MAFKDPLFSFPVRIERRVDDKIEILVLPEPSGVERIVAFRIAHVTLEHLDELALERRAFRILMPPLRSNMERTDEQDAKSVWQEDMG